MKILAASILASAIPTVTAQEQPPLAKLLASVSPSIVTVRVVAELALPAAMGGEKHEMKQETLGTIVDKSGLVMVPTGALDPAARMSMMFGDEAEMTSTVSSLKVVIGSEAKELTGTVVAKDEKLGLSYVKINELGDRQLTPVSFAQGAETDIGAVVWSVERLAEAYDFAPFVARNQVVGRIKKPRGAWLLSEGLSAGAPVFKESGELCGVVAQIDVGGQNQDRESMMMHMLNGEGRGPTTFMVSNQVAANSIAQALEAASKAPEKPAEAKKEGDGK